MSIVAIAVVQHHGSQIAVCEGCVCCEWPVSVTGAIAILVDFSQLKFAIKRMAGGVWSRKPGNH